MYIAVLTSVIQYTGLLRRTCEANSAFELISNCCCLLQSRSNNLLILRLISLLDLELDYMPAATSSLLTNTGFDTGRVQWL